MSAAPSRRSADLDRLRDEGYDIALVDGLLVVRGIPYVTRQLAIGYGTLWVPMRMAGDRTLSPDGHTVRWDGDAPHTATGAPLPGMRVGHDCNFGGRRLRVLCQVTVGRDFRDFHELVTAYVNVMGAQAVLIDPACTARSGGGIAREHNAASPFNYIDTASGRAGIELLSRRLEGQTVAIVGLGGTGSYVLDLVAKTPVAAIHLFDDDTFDQHNAFRAPGAASLDDLLLRRTKVDHLAAIYSRMHRGIVPRAERMERGRLGALDAMDFVFLCIDEIEPKRAICRRLERARVPFVDTGIGVEGGADGVFGLLRVTTSTDGTRKAALNTIPGGLGGLDDTYRSNVQVADLNALAAALAVIRWKRLSGFYRNAGEEHLSVFDVESGRIHTASE
ncbi:ThiF family adenylyltransferase [Sphingomonadaceae bacterium OTU29LAMAA1]|nr:ThiF family adenylyltransferase [Sphingomonadaceae bacterium OTU29LAMAA1]